MIELTVSIPNDSWWSANSRGHWAVKKRCTDDVYDRAYWEARNLKNELGLPTPVFHRCHVTAYIAYPPRAKRVDPGNASPMVKVIIDAMTRAGYWEDDDSTHLVGPDYRLADRRSKPFWHDVILHIEELPIYKESQ